MEDDEPPLGELGQLSGPGTSCEERQRLFSSAGAGTTAEDLGGNDRQHVTGCSQANFDQNFLFNKPAELTMIGRLTTWRGRVTCSSCLHRVFPVLEWGPRYSLRHDLFSDLISGLTVGVMHLPQGLAYAMLAGVPPVTGLYMAFFPVLLYVLMGTSRHVSMGTLSLVCIMTRNVVLKYSSETHSGSGQTGNNTDTLDIESLSSGEHLSAVQVATAVCLAVGIWQLLLGCLQLGALSVVLNDTLMSGFSTAAAVHVLVSQLSNLTGIPVRGHTGLFKVVYTVMDIFTNIKSVNIVTSSISIISMIFLVIYMEVIKPLVERRCRHPFPIELTMIVVGTLLSSVLSLEQVSNVKVVGDIPLGLPSPTPPPVWLLPHIFLECFGIAVVAFSITLSMASILAKNGNYSVDANQELVASGAGNVFASFFSCVPFAASLSRSLIQQTVGGRTQVASLFSCALLLLVLLAIGPFFQPLPNCILSSIIAVALKKMFQQASDLRSSWRRSRPDGLLWLATFLGSVLLDIDVGLALGVAVALACLLLLAQRLDIAPLGAARGVGEPLYLDTRYYRAVESVARVCIIRVTGCLHFANKSRLERTILSLVSAQQPPALLSEQREDKSAATSHPAPPRQTAQHPLVGVVLDLQAVPQIDPHAAAALQFLCKKLAKSHQLTFHLAGCSVDLLYQLRRAEFFSADLTEEERVFPRVQDAVHGLLRSTTGGAEP